MQLIYKQKMNFGLAVALLFLSGFSFGDSEAESFDAVVAEVYKQYPVEPSPNASDDKNNLQIENIEILRRYFTREVALIIRSEYEKSLRTRELGSLSFDILYSSQDPYAKDLKIEKIGEKEAKVCFKNYDESKNCLIFLGEKENGSYKIRDIKFLQLNETLRHLLKLSS